MFVKCLLLLSFCVIFLIIEMDFKYLVLNNYRVENNIDKIMKYGGLIKYYRIFRYGLDV